MKKNVMFISSCLIPIITGTTITISAKAKTGKPNIIIINCDDLGYGDLSCFGSPTIKTPNIDKLAYEGQKWTSFYAGAPSSSPSRACLFTGRLGIRTGMYGDYKTVMLPDYPGGIPEKEYTIAELLKSNGYKTACIGKWHIGHKEKYLPLNNGFDYFYGYPFSNDMSKKEQAKRGNTNYPFEYLVMEQNKIIDKEVDQSYLTQQVTSTAIQYIKESDNTPFFLYIAHPMPHFPVYASEPFIGKSYGGKYGDVIEEIDWTVGEIIKCLHETHKDKNTLIIFTSDNGPALKHKEEGGCAGPLREGKGTHFEGGFRVPCIIWGNMVDPGTVTTMGSNLDLLPTICEMTRTRLPEDRVYDGVSLYPTIENCHKESPREIFFYYRGSKLYAVRKGKYKLHILDKRSYKPDSYVKLEAPLLYNLSDDPEEKYNIAKRHHDIVEELTDIILEHQKTTKTESSIFDL